MNKAEKPLSYLTFLWFQLSSNKSNKKIFCVGVIMYNRKYTFAVVKSQWWGYIYHVTVDVVLYYNRNTQINLVCCLETILYRINGFWNGNVLNWTHLLVHQRHQQGCEHFTQNSEQHYMNVIYSLYHHVVIKLIYNEN